MKLRMNEATGVIDCTMTAPRTYTYVIINNIPKDYHSSDLRRFFSQAIETACFKCFHFRHRPELKINAASETENPEPSRASSTRCCVVVMKGDRFAEFRKRYHRKHWLMKNGEPLAQRCFIAEINVQDDSTGTGSQTADSAASPDHPTFTRSDLQRLSELHPPAVMPCGNVGTPSSVFLQLIKECRLPASVIGKLGLTFAREKKKGRFSAVPPMYGDVTVGAEEVEEDEEEEKEEEENVANVKTDNSTAEETNEEQDKSSSEDEDGTLEEWERHEALHADEFERSRTKERLYEEKIELKWEKGGSGLVFYTDTYRWKQDEGDFDEQTADDWDVDMSGYYDSDPEAGDKDSRDYLSMRRSERRRRGEKSEGDTLFSGKVGRFERHTKGIGRKVLERQGWREGSGLGASSSGMAEALGNDGQPAHVKTGFGYRGEKLNRYPVRKPTNEILISTVYDDPDRLVKTDTLYRRHGETVSNMTFKTDAYGVTSRRAASAASGSEAGFVRPTDGK